MTYIKLMKLIISPAKTLDFETPAHTKQKSEPLFAKETKALITNLKKLKTKDIKNLMDLSDKLAVLNFQRFQDFGKQPKKQAILAYRGDVYTGLATDDFTDTDFKFAQEHLRIITGLYGLLRPLDLIEPYRLEMGTKLKTAKARDLYQFWGDKLTKELGDELIINLASNEYSNAVKPKDMITVNFYETKNGKPRMIGLLAKKARGMMARYIIKNKITTPEKIKKFDYVGYEFDKKTSNENTYNFVR